MRAIVPLFAALCACGHRDAGSQSTPPDAGELVQRFICGPQPYPYNVPSPASVVVHVDCLGPDQRWYMAMWTYSTVDLFDTGIWSTTGCSAIRVREWTFLTGSRPPDGVSADPPTNCN
jgi:hypothetical protein